MGKEFENIEKRIRSVGRILQLTTAQLEKLTTPEHVWSARLRVKMRTGRGLNFKAWRVQHSSKRGSYKGGIRFHPAVTLDLLKALALEMSLKTAVVGLPLGGSKGGVRVDPKKLTRQELEALSRAYVRHFYQHLGPYQDIPATDVGANEKVMAWMVDEFKSQISNIKCQRDKSKIKNGMGNLEGLDIKEVLRWKEEHGDLTGFPHVERITNEELLELPVDILVPAALGNVITARNAGKIKAKIILELANGPTTPEADKILRRKGVVVIPDILANAGGVTVSYFEWRQNLDGQHWTEGKVNRELEKILVRAVKEVGEMGEKYKVDLRTAAYLLAVGRLVTRERPLPRDRV